MKWISSFRPPVLTGVTSDGWLEWAAGSTQVDVYEDEQGRHHFEVREVS